MLFAVILVVAALVATFFAARWFDRDDIPFSICASIGVEWAALFALFPEMF